MATELERDILDCQALVIDSNATSRSILVAQLRDYGVGRVVQCSRVQDARSRLETTAFDFVLCEHNFNDSKSYSGQSLLDDLRRAQLLPFSTVFFMVTGESSYARVAEAAESALDGYLLKPFTTSALFERLTLARLRKAHLKPIFTAIEAQDFEEAARLCIKRFEAQAPYWLYAARIGAELLLRLNKHDEARVLFEAVINARALPWAKLGVARSQIESGQTSRAVQTLDKLIGEDASFADAYDVMGRAQVELGNFADALETYRTASSITPDSVVRLQKFGMMAYYMGDREAASKALARAAILGLDSKMFDFQSIILLAFSYFQDNDRKGLDRCASDLKRVLENQPDNARVLRFAEIVGMLQLIIKRQFSQAVGAVRDFASRIRHTDFDFEAACNFGSLLSVLVATSINLDESASWIHMLGMRYANTRGLTELLASACTAHAPYAEEIRQCLVAVNKIAEKSVSLSLSGDPEGAVRNLIQQGEETLNAKLVDLSHQVLHRHHAKIADAATLMKHIEGLRARCGTVPPKAVLGQESERAAGGVSLRMATPAAAAPPVAAPAPPPTEPALPDDPFRLRP
jgi:tetratricopeptide (TPR) repeat protein